MGAQRVGHDWATNTHTQLKLTQHCKSTVVQSKIKVKNKTRQVWSRSGLWVSLSTTALMDNTAKHTHMDRHTHHPVKDNMKIPWSHKHIFRKLILTLNGDMTLIMHIHTKRDVEVFQRLGARMFLLLLNESHMVNLWLTQRHILFWKKIFNIYEECWFGGG